MSTSDTSAFYEDLSGPSSFPFLSWRSPARASNLPEGAIHRLWSLSFLQNGSEELALICCACPNWLQHLLLTKKYFFYPLSCPSRAECHIWKGWKKLSLGCFALEASQQMVLWAIFCLKVLGRTWQQGDQLGSRRQDVARKLHMRTEALYSTWWRKTLGNTRNRHGLMLLSTVSAS